MKLCNRPSGKCAWERATSKHKFSQRRSPGRSSEFAQQLLEKQKAKAIYGIVERQFRNYYREAARRQGATGNVLISILESRLDNIVFRLGFANSRAQARQNVSHGHFIVNGRKVNIPSYQVKPGDEIKWSPKALKSKMFENLSKNAGGANIPDWLKRDGELKSGQVITIPEEAPEDLQLATRLIVEYYSRR